MSVHAIRVTSILLAFRAVHPSSGPPAWWGCPERRPILRYLPGPRFEPKELRARLLPSLKKFDVTSKAANAKSTKDRARTSQVLGCVGATKPFTATSLAPPSTRDVEDLMVAAASITSLVSMAIENEETPSDDNSQESTLSLGIPLEDGLQFALRTPLPASDSEDDFHPALQIPLPASDSKDDLHLVLQTPLPASDSEDDLHLVLQTPLPVSDSADDLHLALQTPLPVSDSEDDTHLALQTPLPVSDSEDDTHLALQTPLPASDSEDDLHLALQTLLPVSDFEDDLDLALETPLPTSDSDLNPQISLPTSDLRDENVQHLEESLLVPSVSLSHDEISVQTSSSAADLPASSCDNAVIIEGEPQPSQESLEFLPTPAFDVDLSALPSTVSQTEESQPSEEPRELSLPIDLPALSSNSALITDHVESQPVQEEPESAPVTEHLHASALRTTDDDGRPNEYLSATAALDQYTTLLESLLQEVENDKDYDDLDLPLPNLRLSVVDYARSLAASRPVPASESYSWGTGDDSLEAICKVEEYPRRECDEGLGEVWDLNDDAGRWVPPPEEEEDVYVPAGLSVEVDDRKVETFFEEGKIQTEVENNKVENQVETTVEAEEMEAVAEEPAAAEEDRQDDVIPEQKVEEVILDEDVVRLETITEDVEDVRGAVGDTSQQPTENVESKLDDAKADEQVKAVSEIALVSAVKVAEVANVDEVIQIVEINAVEEINAVIDVPVVQEVQIVVDVKAVEDVVATENLRAVEKSMVVDEVREIKPEPAALCSQKTASPVMTQSLRRQIARNTAKENRPPLPVSPTPVGNPPNRQKKKSKKSKKSKKAKKPLAEQATNVNVQAQPAAIINDVFFDSCAATTLDSKDAHNQLRTTLEKPVSPRAIYRYRRIPRMGANEIEDSVLRITVLNLDKLDLMRKLKSAAPANTRTSEPRKYYIGLTPVPLSPPIYRRPEALRAFYGLPTVDALGLPALQLNTTSAEELVGRAFLAPTQLQPTACIAPVPQQNEGFRLAIAPDTRQNVIVSQTDRIVDIEMSSPGQLQQSSSLIDLIRVLLVTPGQPQLQDRMEVDGDRNYRMCTLLPKLSSSWLTSADPLVSAAEIPVQPVQLKEHFELSPLPPMFLGPSRPLPAPPAVPQPMDLCAPPGFCCSLQARVHGENVLCTCQLRSSPEVMNVDTSNQLAKSTRDIEMASASVIGMPANASSSSSVDWTPMKA